MRHTIWLLFLSAMQAAVGQATVRGSVYDSVAHAPLALATVQLVSADDPAKFARSVAADSIGRFSFADVPAGRYMLGFYHPRLDTLGVDAPAREIRVAGRRSVDADLGVPGAARLVRGICGDRPSGEISGVLMGVVRDARSREPIGNVTVAGEWFDLLLSAQGTVRRPQRLVATTRDNGWFGICDVPAGGTLTLSAARNTDTARVELQVPADGFLHRDVYFDSGLRDARVTGLVVDANDIPLANAQVTIGGAPPARTNALGQWSANDAPYGTRALDVRAVGYYPEHRTIDVLEGMPPQRIVLSTMKAVLDTVRVRAVANANRDLAAFETRRRSSGAGTFVTRDEIARRNPQRITDLLRTMPRVRIRRNIPDTTSVQVGEAGQWCTPLVFVDGMLIQGLSADDMDDVVDPRNIAGIEVYTGIMAPPQFQVGMNGCGSIVIWRR